VELLAHGEFLREAENAPIAADEHSLSVLREGLTRGRDPRCLDRHAEPHAVTLPESVRFCGHGAINKSPAIRLARRQEAGSREKRWFVVPSNNALAEGQDAARMATVLSFWRAGRLERLPGPDLWRKLKGAGTSPPVNKPFAALRERL
jgi:hypothetical protein